MSPSSWTGITEIQFCQGCFSQICYGQQQVLLTDIVSQLSNFRTEGLIVAAIVPLPTHPKAPPLNSSLQTPAQSRDTPQRVCGLQGLACGRIPG
jgi:hypothetical protein